MYCPARGNKYEEGDTSNFVVPDGFIHFCEDFTYLCAIISNTFTSDKRIAYAFAAGLARPSIFAKKGVSVVAHAAVLEQCLAPGTERRKGNGV
jgi:hypothetical protein